MQHRLELLIWPGTFDPMCLTLQKGEIEGWYAMRGTNRFVQKLKHIEYSPQPLLEAFRFRFVMQTTPPPLPPKRSRTNSKRLKKTVQNIFQLTMKLEQNFRPWLSPGGFINLGITEQNAIVFDSVLAHQQILDGHGAGFGELLQPLRRQLGNRCACCR